MAKEFSITIDNFQTIGLSSMTGFENIRCLNVSDEPGIAKVQGKLALSSGTTIPSLPIAGVKFDNKYYVVDENQELFKNDSGWTQVTTDFADGKVSIWRGYLLGAEGTNLYSLSDTGTKTTVDASLPSNTHNMCLVGDDDKVYIIGGNNISVLEEVLDEDFDPTDGSTYTVTDNVLNLPVGVDANCCTAWNGNIVIGADDGYIYVWNGTDDNFTDKVRTPEESVNQIITTNRKVYLQAGKFGNLYFYDGTRAQLIKRGPESILNYGNAGKTFEPESIAEIDNKLLYGVRCSSGGTSGIYSYDLTTGYYTCEAEVSGGNTEDMIIGVILPTSEKTYYVGWENGDTTTYGLDLKGSSMYDGDEAYLTSQYYFLPTGYDKQTFQNSEINFAKPLTSGDSAKVYYRETLSDAWTLHETIDTVGTLRQNLKSLPAERAIQIKCVLNDDAELINIILK